MLARDYAGIITGNSTETVRIGPFAVRCLRVPELVRLIQSAVQHRSRLDIAICNAHTILTALDDPEYSVVLQEMTLLNDGVGIGLASRILNGQNFPENLNGTDLVPRLLGDIEMPMRLYLLGAQEEQLLGAKAHIEATFPQHVVVGHRNGYFDDPEAAGICADINAAEPDLLLVAMGNPRQEVFIVRNRARLDVPVAIGVGALFDFMSGAVVRAPAPVRAAGLEWLFRLLQEPRRLFRRYVIGIPRFLYAILKLKYRGT
ncbi:MAG: WecB/TagA/CpsF family glycosyltransferase [Roseibium sp.]